ncbi:hypothetical protein HDG38_003773 [Paraburkholderia sp. WSM4177]|nr:hypothetical protein [Paraburkholderia sp. WSM4177]MBB5485692.1 hypothetical protein [Paraburkholderia sp. WSM4180]
MRAFSHGHHRQYSSSSPLPERGGADCWSPRIIFPRPGKYTSHRSATAAYLPPSMESEFGLHACEPLNRTRDRLHCRIQPALGACIARRTIPANYCIHRLNPQHRPARLINRHSEDPGRLGPLRGFLPRGLFNACPHALSFAHEPVLEGRHRINLNDKRRSPSRTDGSSVCVLGTVERAYDRGRPTRGRRSKNARLSGGPVNSLLSSLATFEHPH